jgi:hypothetical protein
VNSGNDRSAKLPDGVKNAIEDLSLSQPLLLSHVLALVHITADAERAVSSPSENSRTHRRSGCDRFECLDQLNC